MNMRHSVVAALLQGTQRRLAQFKLLEPVLRKVPGRFLLSLISQRLEFLLLVDWLLQLVLSWYLLVDFLIGRLNQLIVRVLMRFGVSILLILRHSDFGL